MNIENQKNSTTNIVMNLSNFWKELDCILISPSKYELSSILLHPVSFFSVLNNKGFNAMSFQTYPIFPEINYKQHEYYNNLNFQVIINSIIEMPQKSILNSLKLIGLDLENNTILFENLNLDDFIFKINANGYDIIFNGNLIAKMYYIQNIGYKKLNKIPLIISYNLNVISSLLKDNTNLNSNNLYNDIISILELNDTNFILDKATNNMILEEFENFKNIAIELLKNKIIISSYTYILKAKHCLDILSERNFITQNNKKLYSKSLRDLINACCNEYLNNKQSN